MVIYVEGKNLSLVKHITGVRTIIKKTARIGLIAVIMSLFFLQAMAKPVVPSGQAIGIRLELSGLLVTAVEANQVLQKGDFIQDIKTIDEFFSKIRQGAELNVLRKGKSIKLTGTDDMGRPKLKNSITGIGTLTYYDIEKNQIYAIGHKMIDIETGIELPFNTGTIYKSKIAGIKRIDERSSELRGIFNQSNEIGKVISNTNEGIVGDAILGAPSNEIVETAKPVKGSATILSTIKGENIEEYKIQIEQVLDKKDKNIAIKIIDDRLLSQTGGIAAGMSGSPIMQNGCLVGVITHVSVNEPQFGYGRVIE